LTTDGIFGGRGGHRRAPNSRGSRTALDAHHRTLMLICFELKLFAPRSSFLNSARLCQQGRRSLTPQAGDVHRLGAESTESINQFRPPHTRVGLGLQRMKGTGAGEGLIPLQDFRRQSGNNTTLGGGGRGRTRQGMQGIAELGQPRSPVHASVRSGIGPLFTPGGRDRGQSSQPRPAVQRSCFLAYAHASYSGDQIPKEGEAKRGRWISSA
jgi:hypothetical protein